MWGAAWTRLRGMTWHWLHFLASPALAHTGAEHALSFASGFKHPFTGLDHMLAMVAVGLWAGLNGGRALWAWPVAFVGVMLLGGALGIAGVADADGGSRHPRLGGRARVCWCWRRRKLPVAAGAMLVAAFALLHGHAHGAELPGDAAAVTYAAGFALATAIAARHRPRRRLSGAAATSGRLLVRGAGALVAAAGVALARHLRRPRMIPGEVITAPGDIETQRRPRRPSRSRSPTPATGRSRSARTTTSPRPTRRSRFDRAGARGMRLDIAAGTAVRFEPGQTPRRSQLVAFAGDRARLRLPRQGAWASSRMPHADDLPRAPTPRCTARPTGDRVRLADTELIIEVEKRPHRSTARR